MPPMPINFRVFGGNRDSSSSSNNGGTTRSLMGGNNTTSNTTTGSNNSRISTYPGQRIQRNSNSSNLHSNGDIGIGVGSNTSIDLMSSINNSSIRDSVHLTSSHNQAPYVPSSSLHTQSQLVIQGSNVPSFSSQTSTLARPTPPGRTSVGSTSVASPDTPYVTNTHMPHNIINSSNSRSSNNCSRSSNSRSIGNIGNSSNSNSRGIGNISSSNNVSINITGTTSRPGAFSVTRSNGGGSSQVYRVTVPPGVTPGNEFTVHAGNRRVRVRCPATSRPGHSLQITLPPEPVTTQKPLRPAPLTKACVMNTDSNVKVDSKDPFMRQDSAIGTGGAVDMSPEVLQVNQNAASGGGTAQTFLVTIPENIYPGMTFNVNAGGQKFKVTCPPNARPNSKVRIVAPSAAQNSQVPEEPDAAPKMQVYEVCVPQGVRPNQPFTLMANNQRVLVTCPPNVHPGQKIRFQLPVPSAKPKKTNIQLSYKDDSGSSGWERTVRATDLKFQWVRVVEKNDDNDSTKKSYVDDLSSSARSTKSAGARVVEDMEAIDFSKSAYVRKIQYLEGNDARMRTGTVTLIPAQDAVVDSKLVENNYQGTNHSKTLLHYNDIANIQSKSLDEKVEWFRTKVCEELYTPWENGHVKIVVRRDTLLQNSVDAIMALGRDDMRKRWRIEFAGEPGIEAGGLTREWFQLVTEQIFDPDLGLWLSSVNNQMSLQINHASRKYSTNYYEGGGLISGLFVMEIESCSHLSLLFL